MLYDQYLENTTPKNLGAEGHND